MNQTPPFSQTKPLRLGQEAFDGLFKQNSSRGLWGTAFRTARLAGIVVLLWFVLLGIGALALRSVMSLLQDGYFLQDSPFFTPKTPETSYEFTPVRDKVLKLESEDHIGILTLEGGVGSGIDGENVALFLASAAKQPSLKALVLYIDSPGGSSMTASRITEAMAALKKARPKLPIYTFTDHMMASGGYWIGVTADEIWADAGALVGSIGVYFHRNNYSKLLNTLGIKETTVQLGPWTTDSPSAPENPALDKHQQTLVQETYIQFIQLIQKYRGKRINPRIDPNEIYSGGIFLPRKALYYGLIDHKGRLPTLLHKIQLKLASQDKQPQSPKANKKTKSDKIEHPLPIVKYSAQGDGETTLYDVLLGEDPLTSKLQGPIFALDQELAPSTSNPLLKWLLN